MTEQVQLRRGTTAQHATFTGAVGEVTVDTDKKVPVTHDGATAGGFPSIRAGLAQIWTALQTFSNGIVVASGATVTGGLSMSGGLATDALSVSGTAPTGAGITALFAAVPPITAAQVITANAGIKFPATQVPVADPNTLDDYEEGTWTPVVFGTATYTTQVGTYTKIGREVFIKGRLKINVLGTGSATQIFGLPFTSEATSNSFSGATIPLWLSLASSFTTLGLLVEVNDTKLSFYGATAAASSLASVSALQNGADVIFSGQYNT